MHQGKVGRKLASISYEPVLNLIYDSNDVYVTEFGRLSTNNNLATFDANMSSTDVNLIISPLDNNLSIKVGRTSITS